MIFVTVGTNEAAFDRLVTAAGALVSLDDVLIQHGASAAQPPGARCVDFLPFDELVRAVRESRAVVTHAGVGSVMTALANGRRPFVVPRLRRFDEAVDDHQLTFARAVAAAGLVELVEDPTELVEAVSADGHREAVELGPARQLVAELREFLREVAGAPGDEDPDRTQTGS